MQENAFAASDILSRWKNAAELMGVPSHAYKPQVRVISDKSGKNRFKFGLIFNEYRASRPSVFSNNGCGCRMCNEAIAVLNDDRKCLIKGSETPGFIVTPNIFPPAEGASIAIALSQDCSRPMYTSSNLGSFLTDVKTLLPIAKKYRFELYHQTIGAGATIPIHEHWHFTNWRSLYSQAGEVYGFDAAERETLASGIYQMKDFPFAHIIFDDSDINRIHRFLQYLNKDLGKNYSNLSIPNTVPHTFSSGKNGILIAPFKKDVQRSMGSESPTGHWIIMQKELFESATYEDCLARLSDTMYTKEELRLERLLL